MIYSMYFWHDPGDPISDMIALTERLKRPADRPPEVTTAEIDADGMVTIRTVDGKPRAYLSRDDFFKILAASSPVA